jgi:gliding motility-associated-like protein
VVNIGQPYNICLNSLPFPITFSDLNKFSLGNDTLICSPSTIELNAEWQNAVKYLWQDGSSDKNMTIDRSDTYWVELKDGNGCAKRDSITVMMQNCDECQLFIPSAFTPNNDGLNDRFRVKPQCANIGLQAFTMSIYNRWGQLIFKTNDINNGWNGMYKGVQLPSGVYIYFVDYSFKETKSLQQKGTIVLLK